MFLRTARQKGKTVVVVGGEGGEGGKGEKERKVMPCLGLGQGLGWGVLTLQWGHRRKGNSNEGRIHMSYVSCNKCPLSTYS